MIAFELVNESKVAPRKNVIEFVERIVVALVVGNEELSGLIQGNTHREAMSLAEFADFVGP